MAEVVVFDRDFFLKFCHHRLSLTLAPFRTALIPMFLMVSKGPRYFAIFPSFSLPPSPYLSDDDPLDVKFFSH